MKQYVVDQIRKPDEDKLRSYLENNFGPSELGCIYWIPIATELLTEKQLEHEECSPHLAAVQLDSGQLCCEFLIRTKNRIRCECMGYATSKQREWLIETIDAILEKLGIRV